MPFSFAEAKANARRIVHSTFGVRALFKDSPTSTPVELQARWHSRLVLQGAIENSGAEVIEGIDRVVFNREQLAELGISPVRLHTVSFPDYPLLGTLVLDFRRPYDGPIDEIWEVTR